MSIRIDKSRLTQAELSDYEKQSVPFSITLPIAQEPAQNPNQPAQPTSEAPVQPSPPKPAEPSS
jgi:hypothetical protein